ncbi:hypothetical protein H5T52_10455 [Candidatus Bipolaricaulota bacterium]|nr:hypothetical protein [Candidatus Bipolaricaulota bacterium]
MKRGLRCRSCGGRLQSGHLPSTAVDLGEVQKHKTGLAKVREAIAKLAPEKLKALRAELTERRQEIERLRREAPPDTDVEALLADPLAEVERKERELQAKEAQLKNLEAEAKALEAKVAAWEAAEARRRKAELESQVRGPWPGEEELTGALAKWVKKHAKAFEEAVKAWNQEAARVGAQGRPPTLRELLWRCWEKAQG